MASPYLDSDGYPTDEGLEMIEKWTIKSKADCLLLLGFVAALWRYPNYLDVDPDAGKFVYSTAGWSGNESLIEALHKNFLFWSMCWYSSKRGGRHEFKLDLWKQ